MLLVSDDESSDRAKFRILTVSSARSPHGRIDPVGIVLDGDSPTTRVSWARLALGWLDENCRHQHKAFDREAQCNRQQGWADVAEREKGSTRDRATNQDAEDQFQRSLHNSTRLARVAPMIHNAPVQTIPEFAALFAWRKHDYPTMNAPYMRLCI